MGANMLEPQTFDEWLNQTNCISGFTTPPTFCWRQSLGATEEQIEMMRHVWDCAHENAARVCDLDGNGQTGHEVDQGEHMAMMARILREDYGYGR